MMIPRHAETLILDHLGFFPVVGLVGPRQVGKTTTAKALLDQIPHETIYLDLELPSDLQKLVDAEAYLRFHQDKCVVIDEVQRLPSLFPLLRAIIDQDRRPGRFLVLGSASPELIRSSAETLAGRIAYLELTPFLWSEVRQEVSMADHWLKGGFPQAVLAPRPTDTWRWLEQFIRTFIERDLRELGYDISPATLRRMLLMISHLHGGILNQSDLARSLGVSTTTIKRYLDLLEGSFVIHRLAPFHANLGKRLVKAPRLYLRDSGLLHALQGISSHEQLFGHVIRGASWEGYVVEQIRRALPQGQAMYFFRTHAGAEIDLYLPLTNGRSIAIEIKVAAAPSVSKGFYQSLADLEPTHAYVIIPEGEPYPSRHSVWITGLAEFLADIWPGLLEGIKP